MSTKCAFCLSNIKIYHLERHAMQSSTNYFYLNSQIDGICVNKLKRAANTGPIQYLVITMTIILFALNS